MEWVDKYWKIIATVAALLISVGGLQAQVVQNSSAIDKKADAAVVDQLKEDVENLKDEQQEQTEIKINQEHMKDDLQEMKDGNKETQKLLRELINKIGSKP